MSEYWVSRKRHHCKYCNIDIADDVPSRQHHENGVRHKGERFVRGLYKAGEKDVKDRDEETREMERINKAATAAYAQDVGAGLGGVGPSSRGASVAAPAQKNYEDVDCCDMELHKPWSTDYSKLTNSSISVLLHTPWMIDSMIDDQ